MKYFLFYFRRIDWILTISVLLLATLGLLMIYSIGSGRGSFVFFKRQVFFLVGGLALMFLMSLVDWRIFRDSPYLILGLFLIFISWQIFFKEKEALFEKKRCQEKIRFEWSGQKN